MLILFSKIILGVSLVGSILIVLRKIPLLRELPDTHTSLRSSIRRRAAAITPDFPGFSYESFLHKFLSKSKVFLLRAERKINHYLRNIRQKNKKEKEGSDNDEYWDKLKKEVEDEN